MYWTSSRLAPRTKFSEAEDWQLRNLVSSMPRVEWIAIGRMMGTRTGRQCRERYNNYLAPSVKLAPWSEAEDCLLLTKYAEVGQKWAEMTEFFDNRTAVAVKNRYAKIAQPRSPDLEPPVPEDAARERVQEVDPHRLENARPAPFCGIENIFRALDRMGEAWFAAEAEIKYLCHAP
jgi:hypothetical protein